MNEISTISESVGVYYFGSLKNGFECYPQSNLFDGYYNNFIKDDLLTVRKHGSIVRYVYVKYDLVTSVRNGREGSCFGVVLEFTDIYFNDIKEYYNFFYEGVMPAIINEKQLLKNITHSQIAFVPNALRNVIIYLDKWRDKIIDALNKKLRHYISPLSGEINDSSNSAMSMHPYSNEKAIKECFSRYGAINLSASYQVEHYSPSEKKILEKEFERAEKEQINTEYFEVERKQLIEKIKDLKRQLHEAREIIKLRNDKFDIYKSEANKDVYSGLRNSNYKKQTKAKRETFYKIFDFLKENVVYVVIFLVLIVFLTLIVSKNYQSLDNREDLLFRDTTSDSVEKKDMQKQKYDFANSYISEGDDNVLLCNDEKNICLNEIMFLDYAEDKYKSVKNGKECLSHIVEYLWEHSSTIKKLYNDKDELSDYIINNNKQMMASIRSHIKSNNKLGLVDVGYNTGKYWRKTLVNDSESKRIILYEIQ